MSAIKFSFVPERQLKDVVAGDSTPVHVKLYPNNALVFNQEIIRIYDMEGKYIKLFADVQKKTIGWQIIEGSTELEQLSGARQVVSNQNGNCLFGIGKILKAMGYPAPKSASAQLPVKSYKGVLDGDVIYYITLPEIERPYEEKSPAEKVDSEDTDPEA